MLHHTLDTPQDPARVVVLGARGFIGAALVEALTAAGTPVLAPGSNELDLGAADAADRLAGMLRPDDSLVVLAALTPDKGRDIATLMRNLRMGEAVCGAVGRVPVAHVIYMSSDAVYPFTTGRITEETPAACTDLYGVMHRTREIMFESAVKGPLAILRSTLVYGAADTHNSYGANRFRRLALKDGKITLGGGGEETRDHLFVDDAVAVLTALLRRRTAGLANLATGRSVTFDELARMVAAQCTPPAEVIHTARTSPVTHRHFDVTALHKAFPEFRFTPLEEGIARVHRQVTEQAGQG